MPAKESRKTFRARLDEMINQLRQEIISGKLGIGQFLPSEIELGHRFHLSNRSVRKGLDILVQEQLIIKIPKVGNRIINACGTPTIIRFGYQKTITQDAGMSALIDAFHNQYPHIQVQPIQLPHESYSQTVKEYVEADQLDILTMNQNNFSEFAETGSLEQFEPLIPNRDSYPFLMRAFTHNGHLYAQPFIFSPIILCYNKNHFEEAHLHEPDSSWSWNDLLDTAEKLVKLNRRFGFYFHLFSDNRWPIFPFQSGNSMPRGGQEKLDEWITDIVKGIDLCKTMIYKEDVFPTLLAASGADAEKLFLNSNVSIIMTTYFRLNDLKSANFTYDVAPLPHLSDSKTLTVVIGLAINSRSQVKDAARIFVDFMLSSSAQAQIQRNTMSLPAHKHLIHDPKEPAVFKPSRNDMYREIIPTFRLLSDFGLTQSQLSKLLEEIKMYWCKLQDRQALTHNIKELVSSSKNIPGK